MSVPIPQPAGLPIFGNVFDIDPEHGVQSLGHLADKYGEIFKLSFFGIDRYFVSSVELLNEICDEKRFCKTIQGPLSQVRLGIGSGLFTAYHGEHDWEVAHRTLVPAFGPIGIKDMFDEMYDIATQLIGKWARMGSDHPIDVPDDFTRLTLDSIALCAMDKRFNSFYHDQQHPFVDAMVGFLLEAGRRQRRTALEKFMNREPERQFEKDIEMMKQVAQEVINHRRANPSEKKDLLNALLFGKDPKTGERMTDESIMNNMITFLIAGHETTSGMLSFACYQLLKNPESLEKAQEEVDRVVGKGPVTFEHMSKLPYIEAVLRETLRLTPTAPVFSVQPLPSTQGPTVLAGKYYVPAGASIGALLPQIGRDPKAYGADANEFRPDRMFGENFTKLPPNAWKPFGNGARGCIGRPFAWQEAILTLALVLQNFNLRLDDPSYQLAIKQTLTIKPDGFFMKARLREGIDPITLEKKMFSGLQEKEVSKKKVVALGNAQGKPMTILYGSNSGTCEGLSQNLAGSASSHGYSAEVKPLDAATGHFPSDQPVIIISASYEGNPPDNAAVFVEWLKKIEDIKNAQYAVFGCGHKDWVSTYQKIPKLLDSEFKAKGAKQIAIRGESDVSGGKVFDDFDAWQDEKLWPALSVGTSGISEELQVEISTTSRATNLRHNVQTAMVVKNDSLTKEGKRHTEFKLPTNITYEAGDYLALMPLNHMKTISRVLKRFNLPWDSMMTLKKGSHTCIPTGKELSVSNVLSAYVELNTPASRKNIANIEKFMDGKFIEPAGTPSVLDILEANPNFQLPFSIYLSMLQPMRLRQYSISSSPLNDPTVVSISYEVISDEHLGVATNYLSQLDVGSTAHIAIKKSHSSFHLPLDSKTPVIMIGAGTGLAPFRGFIQERAIKIQSGIEHGQAILFIGCRNEEDRLYTEELAEWEKLGAVKVYPAFSRDPEKSEGCKYAQDRLWHERELASKLFDEGARTYICGSSRLGKGVADTVAKIVVDKAKLEGRESTYEKALKWWEDIRGERYAVDVFD